MQVITPPNRFLKKGKDLIQSCRYFWNKVVRGVKIDSPPVFIVGCGHSGTSIVLAILGAHSRIYAVPYESGIALSDTPQEFQTALEKFDRWAIVDGKHRWIEKTPRHIHHIGRILKWYSNAKILLIIRDGRDVACSIQTRTGSLEEGINRWVNDNLAGKEYWKCPSVYVLKYEDLVCDFEFTVRGILKFLNEEYEAGMKDYHIHPKKWYADNISQPPTPYGNNHGAYRNWQINQPFFDGRGKWTKMSEEELTLVNDIAGEMLSEFGYIKKDNST
jgi:hypothetical protein